MAHWKKRFPSKYLQASDLDTPIDATISHIEDELVGTGDQAVKKPVLYFKEKHVKPCVLSKTRSESIELIAGTPDDIRWSGVRVRLQKGRIRYKGDIVDCVDVVAPPTKRPKGHAAPVPDPELEKDPLPGVDADDEEPF